MKAPFIAACLILAATAPSLAQVQDLTDQPLPPPNSAGGGFAGLINPPNFAANRTQQSWINAPRGAGVLSRPFDPEDTVRASIRSRMISTIVLPESEDIVDYSLGDKANFAVKKVQKHSNKLWIWVVNPGYDTNLNVVGKTGAVYSLYIRGEPANTDNITTQIIRISGGNPHFSEADSAAIPVSAQAKTSDQQQSVTALGGVMPDMPPEWLKKGCTFDPSSIRHDREMLGDSSVAPRYVYRDACLTYLDWGPDYKSRTRPGVWKVEDGIDKQVNFDKSRDERFWIIYSTAPLTLRSGDRVTCIKPVITGEAN